MNKNGVNINQIVNTLQRLLSPIYGVMLCGIVSICVLFSDIDFAGDHLSRRYLPPVILLGFGIVFICGIFTLCKRFLPEKKRTRNLLLLFVSFILFFVQLYSVYNYYFITGWDVSVLMSLSDVRAHGGDVSVFSEYFSRYPNNLFLAFIFSTIRKFLHMLGLHRYEYGAILCVQCALTSAAGLLVVHISDYLFDCAPLSIFVYMIYHLLVGASPWVSIPYSDSMGLIFPVLILALYIRREKTSHIFGLWFGLAALSVIGYRIKPQLFIVFIAVLIIESMEWLKNCRSGKRTAGLAGIIIGIICSGLVSQIMISSLDVPVNKEKTFNIPHFLMMGMNPADRGIWSESDVLFSDSFETADERNKANIDMTVKRIQEMGLNGVLNQFRRKTLTNYDDGTFCWSGEGSFFSEVFEKKDNRWCGFFRGLYYTGEYADDGKYHLLWANAEQMLWLTILLLNIFAGFAQGNADKNVIMLSIIGLTVFELLFEARARYLFAYTPFYILLAGYGVHYVRTKLNR